MPFKQPKRRRKKKERNHRCEHFISASSSRKINLHQSRKKNSELSGHYCFNWTKIFIFPTLVYHKLPDHFSSKSHKENTNKHSNNNSGSNNNDNNNSYMDHVYIKEAFHVTSTPTLTIAFCIFASMWHKLTQKIVKY